MKNIINKNNLECVHFVSKDDSLPVLTGILITPNETIATNRDICLKVSNPNKEVFDVANYPTSQDNKINIIPDDYKKIVPFEIFKNLKPALNKSPLPILEGTLIISDVKDESIEFTTTDLEVFNKTISKVIDDEFPDLDAITPDTNKMLRIRLNAEYLGRITKSLKKITDSEDNGISLFIDVNNPESPILLEAKNDKFDQKATALIMPIIE